MALTTSGSISRGMIAGFVATLVISGLMLMKQAMGIMPQLNPVHMLTDMVGASNPLVGWLLHFLIGTVMWGILFVLIAPRLPGSLWLRGVVFAMGPWLLMMIAVMPMAGAGFFGLGMGIGAPVMTLMIHVVYGAVLGAVFSALTRGIAAQVVRPTTITWR